MTSKTVEQQQEICRKEWFKNHAATAILTRPEVIMINWQNPNTWNYGCRFIIHARWLTVVGDIGEAVYEWSQTLTLEFLAGLDFSYFHGKCESSETGRDFEAWDGGKAIERLREFLNYQEDMADDAKLDMMEQAQGFAGSNHEWCDFLYSGNHATVMDDDYTLGDAGNVPHPRSIGHFVGLQMAISQLSKKESA